MSDERHPPAEATELEETFPVSYSIFAMARTHRAIAAAELARLGLLVREKVGVQPYAGEMPSGRLACTSCFKPLPSAFPAAPAPRRSHPGYS